MVKSYIIQEKNNTLQYSRALDVDNPSSLSILDHPIRINILKLLSKQPMYPAQIAKELKMHEQKIYYHVKQLMNAQILEVTEKEEIRGTVAKKIKPRYLSFVFSISKEWKDIRHLLEEKDKAVQDFLRGFITEGRLDADIVVGSPDPHGPHKARARDGHYAIDLAHFLGNFCVPGPRFSTKLDVDVDLKNSTNLILVGGPVTNLIVSKINDFLPAKFSDSRPWGITTAEKTHTEETTGVICKIPNPYNKNYDILLFAGIRFIGTKASVLGFTRFNNQIITKYHGQEEFYAIVQGFDMDGDGKIDNIEVLE